MLYVVVENTPGYLPDADEPSVVSTLREARMVARGLVASLRDFHADAGETCRVRVDSRTAPMSWYITVPNYRYDLGRVVEILATTAERQARACRDCGALFPYDADADRCPVCLTAQGVTAEDIAAHKALDMGPERRGS